MLISDSSPARLPAARTPALLVVAALLLVALLTGPTLAEDAGVWVQTARISLPNEEPVKSAFCPVFVDPVCGVSRTDFGAAVGVDGGTLVIGHPHEQTVHIYESVGPAWLLVGQLMGPEGFGETVAIEGEWIAVGAPDASEVKIFMQTPEGLQVVDSLSRSGCLGKSIAISGERLIAGNPCASEVLAISRTGGNWDDIARLRLEGAESLGYVADIDGGLVVVGSSGGTHSFVFKDGWESSLVTSLSPKDLTVSEGKLVLSHGGVVYVYEDTGGWSQLAVLEPQNVSPFMILPGFGDSMDLEGTTLIVGAPRDDTLPGGEQPPAQHSEECVSQFGVGACVPPRPGAVYVFEEANGEWNQKAKVSAELIGSPEFGSSVDLENNDQSLVVGAPYKVAAGFGGVIDVDPEDAVYVIEKLGLGV